MEPMSATPAARWRRRRARVVKALRAEAVADAVDGEDMARFGGILFQLAPQFGDVRVDGAGRHGRIVSPDGTQQVLAGQRLVLAGEQGQQQLERAWREGYLLTGAQDEASLGVHVHVSKAPARPGCGARAVRAAQQRFDPKEQLHDAEWLRHVVVRARAEAADLVDLLGASAENQDGGIYPAGPERAEDGVPVDAGKHQVEDDEVRPVPRRLVEPLLAGVGDGDVVPFHLEVGAQAEREIALVLHDQDPAHGDVTNRSAGGSRCGAGAAGSATTTRAPPRGESSIQTRPPWASTSSRTTESPIPAPATLRPSTRVKGSNTRSRQAGGIPGPVSSISRRNSVPSRRVRTSIVEPRPPCLTALSRRFSTIWRSAARSTFAQASVPVAVTVTSAARAIGAN